MTNSLVDPSMITMLSELRMPGQPDPVLEILEMYREDGASVVKWIADAHEAGDADQLRRAAHRLKGASANVGATELAGVLTRLEKMARDGRLAETDSDVARVPELFERSVEALLALK